MRYKPRIGDEFHLTGDVIAAKTRHLSEATRSTIALCIVGSSIAALAIAAGVGLVTGEWRPLRTVWDIVSFPMGAVVAFYFPGKLLHGQKDDESTT
jgi:hypothetical protein